MNESLFVKDKFMILGIQDLKQLSTLNPVYINISRSAAFNRFIEKYPPKTHMYRFRLMSLTTPTKIKNIEKEFWSRVQG